MTTFKLSNNPWTISSVRVPVILASSRVSLSNRWRIASTSLSPSNLFANFSIPRLASESQWVVGHSLKRPFFYLLCGKRNYVEDFNHDFYHDI